MKVLSRLLLVLGLGAVVSVCAWAAPSNKLLLSTDRWLRVQCEGDLVLWNSAVEFRNALNAAQDSADLVLVEIESTSSRPDVVLDMVRAMRESRIPVYVYARSFPLLCGGVREPGSLPPARPRPTVGLGPLLLGLAARGFAVDGDVYFRHEVEPEVLELASEKTDWREVYAELAEGATTDLVRRGINEVSARELATAIVAPSDRRWLAVNSETGMFSVLGPDTSSLDGVPAGVPLVATNPETGELAVTIRPADARAIGLCEAEPNGTDAWLARHGQRPSRVEVRTLGTSSGTWTFRVLLAGRQLSRIDKGLDELSTLLDLPDPAKRSVSKDTYRAAGRRSLEKVAQTEEQLAALEQDLRDYPELLRTAPPGQTEVGAKASSFASKWRSMIQSRRDKLAKLKAKAEAFAGQ